MEIANSLVPVAAVSYQKLIVLTVTQPAEVTTVEITIWHVCGTDCVYYNEISWQWKAVKAY